MKRCDQCEYVQPLGNGYGCRRYPPQSLIVPTEVAVKNALGREEIKMVPQPRSILPLVDADFYCGEFKPGIVIPSGILANIK